MPDWSTFELTFKRAMQRYRKHVGRDARSIIVIEDMHAVRVFMMLTSDFICVYLLF